MSLNLKEETQGLVQKYRIRPSKGLGQNFLVDRTVVKAMVKAANLKPNDVVLEVGPGLGVLTGELAGKVKRVVAVEKDRRMIEILRETLKNFDNIELIQGDILRTDLAFPNRYKVVANLPFYLASPLVRKLLENRSAPEEMVLIIQKEVGQRICAKVPDMNLLAVSVQLYAKPEIVSYVSKKSFWPQPKVDSAIIRIKPLTGMGRKRMNADSFFKIVRAGFSQPRKQLLNNFSKSLEIDRNKIEEWLSENNIRSSQRAETLDVKDWLELAKDFPLY